MAEIVIGAGCSHGPSIQGPPEAWARLGEKDKRDPRFDFDALVAQAKSGLDAEIVFDVQKQRHTASRSALAELGRRVEAAKPDVLVVISNAHVVQHREPRPVFSILRAATFLARESTGATFDPNGPSAEQAAEGAIGTMPGHHELATHLIESLISRDFDVGCIDGLKDGSCVDEAFAFCYKWLLDGTTLPMVPFYLSRDLPNQATPARCVALGRQLGAALRECPLPLRVALVASGGLSHQVVDEELDRRVVDGLVRGDLDGLSNLPRDRLNRAPGTPEILNWLVVAGAMAPRPMELLSYEPCYRSLAGTGHGAAIGFWPS